LPEEAREPSGTAAWEIQRQHQHKKQGMLVVTGVSSKK